MSVFEAVAAFVTGGSAYVLIELLWRGRSHVSMFFAGGAAFLLLHGLFVRYSPGLPLRFLLGVFIITAVEFIFGYFVNIRMGLNVWDYSAKKYNLYGQICLPYSIMWGILALPGGILSGALHALFLR